MSETREQFRKRVGGYANEVGIDSEYPEGSIGELRDMAEAIYKLALRDVISIMPPEAVWTSGGEPVDATDMIEQFARERGIDLEED